MGTYLVDTVSVSNPGVRIGRKRFGDRDSENSESNQMTEAEEHFEMKSCWLTKEEYEGGFEECKISPAEEKFELERRMKIELGFELLLYRGRVLAHGY